jgi:hypothetical protein
LKSMIQKSSVNSWFQAKMCIEINDLKSPANLWFKQIAKMGCRMKRNLNWNGYLSDCSG